MRCGKCRKEMRCKVEMFLDIPAPMYGRLGKRALRSASVRSEGIRWEKAMFYCPEGHEVHRL